MKHVFFITGLPRSRTAWFANYLTYGDTMCFHDGYLGCKSIDAFVAKLRAWPGSCVGSSDPMNAWFQDRLSKEFPDAKWVVISRNQDDVIASTQVAFCWGDKAKFLVQGCAEKVGDVVLYRNPMLVKHSHITYDVAESVARYVNPTWSCPKERAEMLLGFNVQMHDATLKELMKKPIQAGLTNAMERPEVSAANRAFMDRVRTICSGNDEAYDWFMQVMIVAHVWDHAVDGDAVNPWQANRAFEALVLDWPCNSFMEQHKHILIPAMRESVEQWKTGTMDGAYAVNRLIPEAIAKSLGVDWQEHEYFITEIVGQLKDEDYRRDKAWAQQ